MATSSKRVQKDVQQNINKFRENENAVYVVRVVIAALAALVFSYVLYVVVSFIQHVLFFKSATFFFATLTFGGYLTFLLTSAIIVAAVYYGMKLMKIVWKKTDALYGNKSTDETTTAHDVT